MSNSGWVCILGLMVVVLGGAGRMAEGAGECGTVSADWVAYRLMTSCKSATFDRSVVPSGICCAVVHAAGQNPSCLCAALLSKAANVFRVKPEAAITIPKRCGMADRPVGYKCGAYTMP